ncbi:hypothetical protein CQW23_12396 [Capsicum baccatum]|uniref:Stomatal closure-related actin-binding protein Ig domain-containing protein n=1 Tax=Capsicum baccatum TaxID=33114 RepID=A0A2G2WSE8_CAPBA|nr:hypothetical protein CQW23_12396 [Capsicum baccatum]
MNLEGQLLTIQLWLSTEGQPESIVQEIEDMLPMSRRAGQNKSKFFDLTGCEMLRSILRVQSCSAEAIDVSKYSIQWYRLSSECRRREPIIAFSVSKNLFLLWVYNFDSPLLWLQADPKLEYLAESHFNQPVQMWVLLLLAAAAIFTAQCTFGVSKSEMQPVRNITAMPKISLSIFTSQCTLGESKEWNATYEKHSSYAKLLKVCILGNLPDDSSIGQIIKLNYGHHQG